MPANIDAVDVAALADLRIVAVGFEIAGVSARNGYVLDG